jgi:hypothetical protein
MDGLDGFRSKLGGPGCGSLDEIPLVKTFLGWLDMDVLDLRKVSRFPQPLASQLHPFFQRETRLIIQLTFRFLNAEV